MCKVVSGKFELRDKAGLKQ